MSEKHGELASRPLVRPFSISGSRPPAVPLAGYQRRSIEQLAIDVGETHRQIAVEAGIHDLATRERIARERGVRVLVAPTGAGKTLILGRAIETLVPDPIVPVAGFHGSVWFWFAPYSGLVDQTRLALRAHCPDLRLRDPQLDREPEQTRDGDVFVSTWGAVAANHREARIMRRTSERAWSLDGMIERLREDGWFIGCVIDEAHVNFGMTATAAATFFTETLRPDSTILATATPRDEKLAAFSKAIGFGSPARIEIAREEAVRANLVKPGLVLAHLTLSQTERDMLEEEETLLGAAVRHHAHVRERLGQHGAPVMPLLLVQVPDKGMGADPARVKEILERWGMATNAISIHTATQPDPTFRTLAADENVEALIFKLSAATGFYAPRAFTLATLRPVVTPEFGVQIIGRVMRVDPRVRAIPEALADPILSHAYVYATGERQRGIESAAERLAALRTAIGPVAYQASMFEIGSDTVLNYTTTPAGVIGRYYCSPASGIEKPRFRVRFLRR